MLILREEQIKIFDDHFFATSVKELATYLRAQYPGHLGSLKDVELHYRIGTAIRQAEGYAIHTVTDVRRFLEFSILLRDATTPPATRSWARDILERSDLSGTRKLDLIEERMTFDAAQKAAR